ncbi:hypothetical protein CsSME_00044142 [Camellia sinensis var. sinensis]
MEASAAKSIFVFVYVLIITLSTLQETNGVLNGETQKMISEANKNGPYLGLVIPNLFEMNPLLQSPSFTSSNLTIDFQGITTQLLVSLFEVEGIVHYGIAGNANPNGPEDELSLEENGDYTREIGYIKYANYATIVTECNLHDNFLNNVWYQPEEVFPIDGTPEERQHAFWVPVDSHYFELSKNLESLELEGCLNSTTCLSETPNVTRVLRGTSASIYLDNAAYRNFLYRKFNVSPVDMESAAVALICFQQRITFITIRALSDLAGGGSAQSNEAATFISLAANNSVTVVVEFIKNLSANYIISSA